MENSKEIFRREIDMIKNIGVKKETTVTEEEIAGKIGISVMQLDAYLNGEKDMPQDGLPGSLELVYNDLPEDLKGVEIIEDLYVIAASSG
jgi:hypothetical protein